LPAEAKEKFEEQKDKLPANNHLPMNCLS